MAGFVIQRVLQAVLVVFVISALVFIGVYAIGNPIDVLISPDAPLASLLRNDREWSKVYEDDQAIIFTRSQTHNTLSASITKSHD